MGSTSPRILRPCCRLHGEWKAIFIAGRPRVFSATAARSAATTSEMSRESAAMRSARAA
jgi:hypothetical protein